MLLVCLKLCIFVSHLNLFIFPLRDNFGYFSAEYTPMLVLLSSFPFYGMQVKVGKHIDEGSVCVLKMLLVNFYNLSDSFRSSSMAVSIILFAYLCLQFGNISLVYQLAGNLTRILLLLVMLKLLLQCIALTLVLNEIGGKG